MLPAASGRLTTGNRDLQGTSAPSPVHAARQGQRQSRARSLVPRLNGDGLPSGPSSVLAGVCDRAPFFAAAWFRPEQLTWIRKAVHFGSTLLPGRRANRRERQEPI